MESDFIGKSRLHGPHGTHVFFFRRKVRLLLFGWGTSGYIADIEVVQSVILWLWEWVWCLHGMQIRFL